MFGLVWFPSSCYIPGKTRDLVCFPPSKLILPTLLPGTRKGCVLLMPNYSTQSGAPTESHFPLRSWVTGEVKALMTLSLLGTLDDHPQVRSHRLRKKHLTQPFSRSGHTLASHQRTQRRISDCMVFLNVLGEEDQSSTLASPDLKHFSLRGQQQQGQIGRTSLMVSFTPYPSHLTQGSEKWEESLYLEFVEGSLGRTTSTQKV